MIGEKIGHFTIKQKLGKGGMGAVYLAEHDIMRKKVAIKVLLPQWTQSAVIVKRFRNEAIAMASLQHPNIVNVDDCGQLPSGAWYIVMEYLDGGSLSRFCKSHGPVSEHVTLQILCQVAAALETAHKLKIVHRDLKPENIFLIATKGNPHFVKVLDWGISKLGEQEDGSGGITNAGMVAGTPAYMAPEQILDLRAADRRADVFALGAIAYRMLTGWLPFQRSEKPHEFSGLSLTAIHALQMREDPIPLRQRVADISDRAQSAVLAALHRDPARRPQTARQFILMLAAAIHGDGYTPAGADIVKAYAGELLEIGNLEETVRAVKPRESKPPSRYRFGDKLGAGGMAEVFKATHVGAEGFTRPVAVKRVLPGFSGTPQFAEMFVQEAKLASLLDHPNIVSVLDFDRDEEGRLFLSMEYVDGKDLAALAATGRLPIEAIIFIVGETLSGLGYAHNLPIADGPDGPCGLIHRDVSPHNVLLSWEGAVKVSDFGIAKARHASAATASMLIKGKPQYMSPEQANGDALDGRSDLFAVGILLWELLTDQHLFEGTTKETLAQVFFRPIPPPSTIVGGIPHDLEAVTMRLLAREKEVRYATAEEAAEDLARCVDAPRNGRAELTRLLTDRFPEITARRSRPSLSGRSSSNSGRSSSNPPSQAPRPSVKSHEAPTRRDILPPHEVPTRRGVEHPLGPSHTTLASAASQATAPSRSPHRAIPILAALFVGVAVLTGFAIYVTTRKSGSPVTPDASTTSIPEGAADASRPIVPETLLTITTDPEGALVKVDDVPRGDAPVILRVPRGRQVTVEARHDGYEPTRQVAKMDHDAQAIALTLRPKPFAPDAELPIDAGTTARRAGSAAAPPRKTNSRSSDDKRPPPEDSKFNPDDAVGD